MISEQEFLRALEEVDNAIAASLPDPAECVHEFSPRFQRKMRALRRRAKHPMLRQAVRIAACFLLACLLLGVGFLAVNPDARAAVLGWVQEQVENFRCYFFAGEQDDSLAQADYILDPVPEGYELVYVHSSENSETFIYENKEGKLIQFGYCYGTGSPQLFVKCDEYRCKQAITSIGTVNLYTSTEMNNSIVWSDAENGVLFCISADMSEDELIALAESVRKNDK